MCQTPFNKKREEKARCSSFFKRNFKLFRLLNLKSLIDRFGSPRNLGEGEREKIIKYIQSRDEYNM
jgi:hypothetical protein